jgi:excinuclease UvrABC nuclease subunit
MAVSLWRLADRKWSMVPRGPGIYCLFLSDRPVYIGQTKYLRARLQNHLSICLTQHLVGNFIVSSETASNLRFSIQPCASKNFRDAMEGWFIAKYRPRFNSLIAGKNSRITDKKPNHYLSANRIYNSAS